MSQCTAALDLVQSQTEVCVAMNNLITWFDREFSRLEDDWRSSIARLDEATLYRESEQQLCPGAEQILRSARIVEQVSGGITAKLWDDPYEWTLPETLRTKDKLIAYVDEVRAARLRAFEFFKDDGDLLKMAMAPSGPMQLQALLLDAMVRARHHQSLAMGYLKSPEACADSSHPDNLRS